MTYVLLHAINTRMKKTKNKAKPKKTNISLKRKIALFYNRSMLLVKLSVVVLICLFIFTDLFQNAKKQILDSFYSFSSSYGFTFQKVDIAGNKNMSTDDITTSLGIQVGDPIFALNMSDIKSRLEENVWVKDVIIERRLPSTISIFVNERTPIAIWQFQQKLYLIDLEGNRITKYKNQSNNNDFGELLHVVGSDANIYAQNLLNALAPYQELKSKIIYAVRHGKRRWDIILDQKITVKMPEDNSTHAYEYLYKMYDSGKLFDQNYKTVDLRDSEKYYIKKY